MENSDLVSIVVPVYNTEKYLKKCLDSVLAQDYENLEIILIDDGSTDGSVKIIDDYQKRDQRIVSIHQKNGGQSRARNVGIKMATGKYLCFVDSDDEIDKSYVSEMITAMGGKNRLPVTGLLYRKLAKGTEEKVYITKMRTQRKNETLKEYVPFLLTMDGRMYSAVNKMFITGKIKDNELSFEEDAYFAEDTEFVLKYLSTIRPEIKFVLKPLYIYNYGTDSSTIKKTSVEWKNWQDSFEDLKKFVGKNPSFRAKFWMNMVMARWRVSYARTVRRAKS